MSLYRSQIGEAWTLKSAVDALSSSARRAGKPGWIWVAGFAYPIFLVYGWDIVVQYFDVRADFGFSWLDSTPRFLTALGLAESSAEAVVISTILFVFSFPLFRLAAGLARVSSLRAWESSSNRRGHPSIKTVWNAGSGLTLSTCGLQVQVALMFFLAFVLCAGPAYFLLDGIGVRNDLATFFIASPVLLLLAIYGIVLSTLIQLALHSLAQNRRGVASAMLHAWRLTRRDAWATARTIAVDGVLLLATACLLFVISSMCAANPLYPLLLGFAGVTRAGYWAQAYRALGGLSPDDGIPGLVPDAS